MATPTKPPRQSADSGTSATPPAHKKASAKRGPTKAAALKALGITKEQFDIIAQVEAARAANDTKGEVGWGPDGPPSDVPGINETIYEPQDSEPAIPNALKSSEERREEAEAQNVPMFIRNLRGTEFGFRLSRQAKGPRTDLKPRGQRGDLVRLEKEDYGDPNLERQLQYQCVELITLAEAREIIAKQAVNQQQQVHPAMAMLRNELGVPYEQGAVKVAPEFNSQGITVATLDPRQMQGKMTDKEVARGNDAIQRVPQVQYPETAHAGVTAPVGGNPSIINDGFARNDTAASRDAIARRRDIHGPAAGLGGVKVSVEPTQRT